MVKQIEEALSKNLGVAEVTVDGQKIRYDRQQLLKELAMWRSKAAAEAGKTMFKGFNISNGW